MLRYKASRLRFFRDKIEPLGDHELFEIETPDCTYRMTKADFYRVFSNVVKTRSYLDRGDYHYPTAPGKADSFIA